MRKFVLPAAVFLAASLVVCPADPTLTAGATKWLDWNNPNVGNGVNFYAIGGTSSVAKDGNGSFGAGQGEVTFTSNNPEPVDQHQFGNAIWGPGNATSLFDASALAGKTGIEMLVNVDPSSTSDKVQVWFGTNDKQFYQQAVSVVRGSTQLVQFPLAGFKSKVPNKVFTADLANLNGTIQISDTWNGYPKPAQQAWKIKFSNIYTY
jgi:hypothetical protein